MRQGQNGTKRGRGRGRRPSNPGNRSYESNGPDVKVRGNAATIVEKYQTLARDAASSGDRIMAENYLQHAEHYQRLVNAAAQANAEREAEREKERAAQTDDGAGDDAVAQTDDTEAAEAEEPKAKEEKADVAADGEEPAAEEKPKRKARRPRKPKAEADAEKAKAEEAVEAAE